MTSRDATHRSNEADEDHDGGDEHDAEADDHEGLSSGALDQHEADEGHADVDDAHAEGGLLGLFRGEAGRQEDGGRVEHGLEVNQLILVELVDHHQQHHRGKSLMVLVGIHDSAIYSHPANS